jgi:hypothetical protein
MLGVFAVVAAYLLITGLQLRSAWTTVQACTPQQSAACNFAWNQFRDKHSNPGMLSALFLFAPLLIGSFVGAPLIGRELEAGTFRFAWTQGMGRTRWAIAMVLSGAILVAGLAGGFGALVGWHDRPLWHADITPRLQASEFPSTGIVVIGWALLAYAVGLLAGLVLRRVVAALGVAMGVTFGLAFAASRMRLHYLPALKTHSVAYVPGSQTMSQWWEHAGRIVSTAQLNTVLRSAGIQQIDVSGGKTTVSVSPGGGTDPMTYLLSHGYTQWTSYQPASRYWTLQWIEFGWLTVLVAVLVGIAFVLLRRRDA